MNLSSLPKNKIRAVFTDLDDTLTEHSLLSSKTLQSLYDLKKKNFKIVIVSGRPAGWADCLMRLFPLDAMIFENGAGLMIREEDKIKAINIADNQDIVAQMEKQQHLFDELKREIPNLKLATDQPYRLFDYAIDLVEEKPHLTESEIQKVMDRLNREPGITAKLSSIHVNYWCGTHTKVTACEYYLKNFGKQLGITKDQVVFSGDSPNDEPLFAYFENSVGVANVKKYLKLMKNPPKYVTEGEGGTGFCELAELLIRP